MKKMLFSILMLLSCGQLQSNPNIPLYNTKPQLIYTFKTVKIDKGDPTKVILSLGTRKPLTLKCPLKVSSFVKQNPLAIATLQLIYPSNYQLRLTSSQGGQRGNKMERPVHQDFTCREWTEEVPWKPTGPLA
jgi:hypothetical protein